VERALFHLLNHDVPVFHTRQFDLASLVLLEIVSQVEKFSNEVGCVPDALSLLHDFQRFKVEVGLKLKFNSLDVIDETARVFNEIVELFGGAI
jgi:hypothetical protein